MRLDLYLAQLGLAQSRSRAAQLIAAGVVLVDGKVVTKAAFPISDAAPEAVTLQRDPIPYVSRGGCKLAAALDAFGQDPAGKRVCDLGSSTGGFTDCLLQRGAAHVYAVDCGTEQLHPSLRKDPRVTVLEGTNARTLQAAQLGGRCELVTADLSFISQICIFPAVTEILFPGGHFISLIKPQFEAGRAALSKTGVVRDSKLRERAVCSVLEAAKPFGLSCLGRMDSPILGADGNHEYLACFVYQP